MELIKGRSKQSSGGKVVSVFSDGIEGDWPNWAKALETYRNPAVALAVDTLAYAVLGPGFYVTSRSTSAKKRVEEFVESVNLKSMLYDLVREMLLTGNSFLEYVYDGDELVSLKRVPLRWFNGSPRVEVDLETLEPVRYNLVIQVGSHVEYRTVPADMLIHFRWNRIDSASPWGYGLAYQLIATQRDWRGRIVPSVFDSEATLRRDLILYMDKAVPRRIIKFDVGDEVLESQIKPEFEQILREPAADVITNRKIEVEDLKAPERIRFEYYHYFENVFTAALRSPVIKLFTTPGFTEASAREAVGVNEYQVRAIREYIEHVIETKVFSRLTPERVELHWGQPELPEYKISDILLAARGDSYNPPVISRTEARRMLRELGWILEDGVDQT
ncbi:MAG: hypothetical protein NZ920_01285 [Aigarchaeota archaeon]|nr:hypothetical protein [Aigarchaeota archaeon]MDW8093075.1 hypothetical protein [Nitrososphaerota archaeon]